MGVMGKFRDNTGVILWILIGSFGLLWVVMDVFDPNALSAGPRALGTVNGEAISFEEYNSRIQYYTNAYTQQTGASMTAETRAIYEAQVWDDLVNATLLEQKMDELGITVTDQELLDMAYGENPDPLIRQYFGREDGTIDRFVVQNVLSSGEYTQEAMAIEMQLRQKRRQDKLSNFVTAGLQVTDEDVRDEFMRRNSFAAFDFVRFPYNEVPDEDITVSDADIRAYYDKNKEQYKQEESYRASFVSFGTLPTSSDSAAIKEELEELRSDFAITEEDSIFLMNWQSTTPYNGVFVDKDELRDEYQPVLDVEEGEVTDIIDLGTSVAIIKNVEETRNEIKFAVLSRAYEALPATIDEAAEQADEFEFFASEETSFEEEAERAGMTPQQIFATKGNAFVSGLGQSQQAMNFLENADEGDISQPIELPTQFVVIRMDEVTPEGYRPLEEVRSQIETQVRNEKRRSVMVSKVSEWLSESDGTLTSLASMTEKDVQTVDNLAANGTIIQGAGREPGVVGAIFSMNDGDRSGVIKGLNAAFVIKINSITQPEMAALDQGTARTIRTELEQKINQQYLSVWLEELKKEADITDNRSRLLQ